MSYELCLFDLDGTLTDPQVGITKSVHYALVSFGIEVKNLDELKKFIGPPLRDSFRDYYGFTETESEQAVAKYREYFSDIGIFENKLYSGVEDFLKQLKKLWNENGNCHIKTDNLCPKNRITLWN